MPDGVELTEWQWAARLEGEHLRFVIVPREFGTGAVVEYTPPDGRPRQRFYVLAYVEETDYLYAYPVTMGRRFTRTHGLPRYVTSGEWISDIMLRLQVAIDAEVVPLQHCTIVHPADGRTESLCVFPPGEAPPTPPVSLPPGSEDDWMDPESDYNRGRPPSPAYGGAW